MSKQIIFFRNVVNDHLAGAHTKSLSFDQRCSFWFSKKDASTCKDMTNKCVPKS